jgi:HEAT repeat protein
MLWWTVRHLTSRDRYRRARAAYRLADLHGVHAVKRLLTALTQVRDPQEPLIGALAKVSDPGEVEPLIALLASPDRQLSSAAAEALGRLGDPRAVAPLVGLLEHPHPEVKKAAEAALANLRWEPADDMQRALSAIARGDWNEAAQLGAVAVAPLLELFNQKSAEGLRRRIVETLGRIADERAIGPLVVSLQDRDAAVRKAAAESLISIGRPAVVVLIASLGGEDQPEEAIAGILGAIGDARAIEPLAKLLLARPPRWYHSTYQTHDRWPKGLEAAVIKALVRLGGGAVAYLVPGLEVERSVVRDASLRALEALGWEPANDRERALHAVARGLWKEAARCGAAAVEPLLRAAARSGSKDGEAALGALASIRDPSTIKALTVGLAYHEAAAALLEQLDPQWNRSEPARAAVPTLLAMLAREEPGHRANTAKALAKIGDPRALGPLLEQTGDPRVARVAVDAVAALLRNFASEIAMPALEPARRLRDVVQESWEDFSVLERGFDSAGRIRHETRVDCSCVRDLAEKELNRRRRPPS